MSLIWSASKARMVLVRTFPAAATSNLGALYPIVSTTGFTIRSSAIPGTSQGGTTYLAHYEVVP